ncbi:MAG: potassium-transporting ATPase subunit KdpC [Anaerolineae bacterium]|nr:potassium-transporting ATPase subunit KdpC [Anaerolineae bacterium]MCB9129642.1 potassium-transporting ATPase subunit KdpC [Anaerolineales bacterium]MCB0229051.1 potassium-transporting ATPase subunit KdpC [Anaerolineae bacterium]MCB0232799.1 potassium-transporting ATPase subunit KdpC [Anaerolineae bacterium]MCB0239432.1 potassium-transporting ATPase subunit KdpC [Anaerolineae bacterium]
MREQLRPALVMLALLILVTGLVYPLAVTAIGRVAFPHQAGGSLIRVDGQVVGSELIGQAFDDPRYFWGRPSATTPLPYNAAASAGSNLGPSNDALTLAVQTRVDALHAANASVGVDNSAPVPVDLVTASGSGLDPHISPAAAEWQVARVARARNLSEGQVRSLVAQNTQDRQLGFLGEPRVNVLELNMALDALQ